MVSPHPANLAVLLTHCGQFILREIGKADDTRCPDDFKAKMHNIRFPLRLRPQTPLGELRALPLQGNKRERVERGGASPLKYFGLEPPE